MKQLLIATLVCALPLGLGSTARAGLIVYDSSPGPTDSDGSEATLFVIANDFVLSRTSTLESSKLWLGLVALGLAGILRSKHDART